MEARTLWNSRTAMRYQRSAEGEGAGRARSFANRERPLHNNSTFSPVVEESVDDLQANPLC